MIFRVLANENYLLGKAWDDRIGCAVAIEVLKQLQDVDHPNIVYAAGSTQEEVGLRGAKTLANLIKPDIAFALILVLLVTCQEQMVLLS